MTSILNLTFDVKESKREEDKDHHKRYLLCVDYNSDERKYRCGKLDILVPNCKLSLCLEELTNDECREIALELRNMLARHGFNGGLMDKKSETHHTDS
jgi:hypothetical protein